VLIVDTNCESNPRTEVLMLLSDLTTRPRLVYHAWALRDYPSPRAA
jgi:hypothetical protein